jgi:hypothetical protein
MASPAQVGALLDVIARTQPELTAFFGRLYYRRPSPGGSRRPAPRRLHAARLRAGRAPAGRGYTQDRRRMDQRRHQL